MYHMMMMTDELASSSLSHSNSTIELTTKVIQKHSGMEDKHCPTGQRPNGVHSKKLLERKRKQKNKMERERRKRKKEEINAKARAKRKELHDGMTEDERSAHRVEEAERTRKRRAAISPEAHKVLLEKRNG